MLYPLKRELEWPFWRLQGVSFGKLGGIENSNTRTMDDGEENRKNLLHTTCLHGTVITVVCSCVGCGLSSKGAVTPSHGFFLPGADNSDDR